MKNLYQLLTHAAHSSIIHCSLLTFVLLFNIQSTHSQTQQRKSFLNGKDVDYNLVPPAVNTTSGVTVENSGYQKATNGVADKDNARLFNTNGQYLYASQFSGGLPVFPTGSHHYLRPEIAICPKPGSCDSFYMFYAHRVYHASSGCATYQLRYYLVDPSKFNSTFPEDGLVDNDVVLFNKNLDAVDNYCPTPPALALSKEKTLGGVKTRQLFVLDYEATGGRFFYLKRYDITPSGISAPVTLYTHPSGFDDLHNFELELSPDGKKLAFGRSRTSSYGDCFVRQPDKDIVLYHLNDDGSLNTSLGTSGLTYIDIPHIVGYQESVVGLEFNTASNRLFASVANDAIWYISNLTSTPTVFQMNPTQTKDFTFSQMELIYNNGIEYIAVAKNQSEVHVINNPSGASPSISGSALYSNANVSEETGYSIQANGSTNKYLLCLPDQVDGDNYTGSAGGWFYPNNSANCCAKYYTPNTIEPISTTQTWSPGSGNNPWGATGDVVLSGDLVINAGVTLTINNMTIRFHPSSRVVIQQRIAPATSGGRLNLSNTTLTGLSCGTTWKGVRVLGISNQPQGLPNQGYLNMSNNATISHAEVGATTYDLESGDMTTSGGFIQTNTAHFLDNYLDVSIPAYPSSPTNLGWNFFDLTNFRITNSYRFGTSLNYRVAIVQNYRVFFRGCTFANDNTSLQSSAINNKAAIIAFDTYLIVDRKTTTTPCVSATCIRG